MTILAEYSVFWGGLDAFVGLSQFDEVFVVSAGFLCLDFHVDNLGIGRSFAAKDGESAQVVLVSLGHDVHAAVGVVVFDVAQHIALESVAVDVAPKADIEHATVNPYVVGFCHKANFSPGSLLRA